VAPTGLSDGSGYACAVLADGQLGDGTTTESLAPVAVRL
jgi:hypothetical protein